MRLFSPSEFIIKALAAFKRFPVTLIWVILFTLLLVVLTERDVDDIFETYNNISLTAILGVSWLIGTQFYIEQFKRKGLWWIKVIIILLLVAFYFTLPDYDFQNNNETPYIRWFVLLIVGHLALLFAPFITVWHPKAYWNYLADMLMAIARSALFSGVFYLGIVLALLAIEYLFGVKINGRRYFQLFLLCLGIINTWVYLSDFPKEVQHNIHLHFHKAIEVFVKFILIPLAALYITILYAYALKICIQWELPKGWVSYLIIALAGLLFIIQFIIHPLKATHTSRVFKNFQPLAYWLLLPLLILFYAAIYKRVSDYGITEARYFLIVIAIFITGATLYLLFSRKQQLRFLPIALAVMGLLSTFGFWGAFSVSKRSQMDEFEKMYTAFAKAENKKNSDPESYRRFSSITRYLVEHDAAEDLKPIIGYNPVEKHTDVATWKLSNYILKDLGYKMTASDIEKKRVHFNNASSAAYDIRGYDWKQDFHFNLNGQSEYIEEGFSMLLNGKEILITTQDSTALTIPTQAFLKQLEGEDINKPINDRDKLTLRKTNDLVDVKIIFNSINLKVDGGGQRVINYASGSVLLKVKK
ncbi:DUF4153 domain-containing protein [Dokdonia sp. Asnod2-E02]|uniref:DUF4153 domain-containing protein n=1 Tax=Dokdonia sp. Asnod2-E02 TaxID=3160574 RepID=UPI003868576F